MKHSFSCAAVLHELDESTWLGRALLFPEVERFGATAAAVKGELEAGVRGLLRELDGLELSRRLLPGPAERTEVVLTVEPTERDAEGTGPLLLPLPVVLWQQGESAWVGYLPSLGIEVIARSRGELTERIPDEARAALGRAGATKSLLALVQIESRRVVTLETVTLEVDVPTPLEHAAERRRREREEEDGKAVLPRVATALDGGSLPEAYEVDEPVRLLAELLTARARRSVLLVGPPGSGKTAIFHEVVRRRRAFGLEGTRFWETSGARLVAGASGFGMWQERVDRICREAVREKAVLHLGSLVELLEVGSSEAQQESVGSFLRPRLSRGELLAVAECTSEQLAVVERRDPALLRAFEQLRVEEPDSATTALVLMHVAGNRRPAVPADAIEEVVALHRRWAAGSACPGQPLRFLRNTIRDLGDPRAVTVEAVREAFTRSTGLPASLVDRRKPFDVPRTGNWLRSRVAGQEEAVGLVVDVLATVVAGLARPGKPIASYLFIGPTGVGKTETAKALAELLFASRDRLVRFDMTEYADPVAVKRLVGGVFGAEGLLTAKVREEPFSVVLFDEVEKADPLFFDLLLQVLGEGRLTDAAGRVASFTNTVVVLTSNLGARSFGRASVGLAAKGAGEKDARRHFEDEVRSFLRPELVNRIDRVVPFLPLSRETLLAIARRRVAEVAGREGARSRALALDVPDDVVQRLVESGTDPRYGARPLRRAIERDLLAPLAAAVNRHRGGHALEARAGTGDGRLAVTVRARVDAAGRPVPVADLSASGGALAAAGAVRRRAAKLARCGVFREVEGERERLLRVVRDIGKLEARQRPVPASMRAEIAPRAELESLASRGRELCARAEALEERFFLAEQDAASADEARGTAEAATLSADLVRLLEDLVARNHPHPHHALLVLLSEHRGATAALGRAYWEATKGERTLFALLLEEGGAIRRERVVRPGELFEAPPDQLAGLGLEIEGRMAGLRYDSEPGLHVLRLCGIGAELGCLVLAGSTMARFRMPDGLHRRGAIGTQKPRRRYDFGRRELVDPVADVRLAWTGQNSAEALASVLETTYGRRLEKELDE